MIGNNDVNALTKEIVRINWTDDTDPLVEGIGLINRDYRRESWE